MTHKKVKTGGNSFIYVKLVMIKKLVYFGIILNWPWFYNLTRLESIENVDEKISEIYLIGNWYFRNRLNSRHLLACSSVVFFPFYLFLFFFVVVRIQLLFWHHVNKYVKGITGMGSGDNFKLAKFCEKNYIV